MADKKPVENEDQRRRKLFNELLENIEKQVTIDLKLKENMEYLFKYSTNSSRSKVVEDKVEDIRELYIEAESLQGEGRAIFHRLFGTEFED
ncbi:MAG TPA: hypothetical protein G4O16_07060 [Dehalococcoidia bacterium]|nr:hypothetical protein [Dehalococcoidia bacterium]